MRAKYGNHTIRNTFGVFQSQLEWGRFVFLFERERKGEIKNLQRQVSYELIPTQYGTKIVHLKTKDKEVQYVREKSCSYVADFVYERNGVIVVEDCKGETYVRGRKQFSTITDVFSIKKKLMLYVHNIEVKIVNHATQWEQTEEK